MVLLPRPTRRIRIYYPILFFFLFVSELLVALAAAQAQPATVLARKNVLILYGEDKSHPAHELTDRGIRSAFSSNKLFEVMLYNEYLDGSRFKDPAITHAFADYLRRKYAGLKIDTIIAVYWKAVDFFLKEAVDVFPETPIVVTQLTRAHAESLEHSLRRRYITGTVFGDDITDFLAAAFQMRPGTKRVALVGGINPSEIYTERLFRKGLEPYLEKLELIDLTRLSMQEILSRIGSLPPDTIVFFSNMFTDGAGQNFVPREALELISRAANAPVFGLFDSYLGYGIVGGWLVSFEEHGREAAALTLRIMGGQSPASIPFGGEQAYVSAYDWRQLRRWKVSMSALPKGSIVINKETTLWDFRYYIVAAIVFFLLETALIIFLIIQRRRKRRAESLLWEKTEELDRFFDVNLDLLCIANTDGYFLRLNPVWESILGYSREELMAKRFLEFIHPDDLESTRNALSTLALQQKVFSFENRYRCKDGAYRWLQWSSVPAGKLIYAAARDITERKQAEQALEERLRFERLISDISARFLSVSSHAVDREIKGALKGIVDFFGVSHCVLMKGFPEEQRAIILHAANADDVPPTPLGGNLYQPFPWTSMMLSRGEVLRVPALDRLPAEASADEKIYRDLGVRSFLIVPLVIEGSSRYAIALSNHGEERVWPEVYIPRLELLGKMLVNKIERTEAELELRKSEERFRMLVETMNEGLGAQNENGVWTYVNDQLCWMLGHLPGDITGHPVTEFLDEANQKVFEEKVQEQGEGNYSPYEITWTHTDGRKVTTIVSPKPIFNSGGQLKEVFAVITDITERKRAEEKIQKAAEEWRVTFDSVRDLVMILDGEFKVARVNAATLSFFNLPVEKIVGNPCYTLMHGTSKPVEICPLAKMMKTKRHEETELYDDKKGAWLHVSVDPILDDKGEITRAVHTVKDVTERKWMEEELKGHQEHLETVVHERTADLTAARDQAESANRAKSEFLSNMSHELRTPLNSILGVAQLMERDAKFPHAYRDALNILSHSGTHLLELINDVLELSKVEAGKTASNITSFDLHSFLGDLEEMIRLRADERGLSLLFRYKPPLPRYIETDVRKLRQILINLLGNAIKYTEKGGVTLRIAYGEAMDTAPKTMSSSLGRLEFEVEDTGIGIAPQDSERIFEPFVQVNPGRTVRDGTGLGLTLSRAFVELLGGEITIRSQLGRGSIFAFYLPVKMTEAATVRTEEGDRQVIHLMPGHPPYRLLVVDDSVENRFVLRRLLEQVGFDVLEAASGPEAVDLYKSNQPSLIWMDLRMPGMDGNEAARRIREAENGRRNEEGKQIHTPIIALTAGVMKDQRPSPHSEVFDGLVYKPFREAEIFGMLEKHLGVQFVYQPAVRSAIDAEDTKDTAALAQADLSILSTDWLNEFYRALRKGHSTQLLRLIDQIRSEHDELAGTLTGLVRIHRFDKLIAVIERALKEKANG